MSAVSCVGQEGLDRDRRRGLAGADDLAHDLVDLAMHRLVEMLGQQEIGDAIERLVVDEDGAQQRLLGFDVLRREPKLFRPPGGCAPRWCRPFGRVPRGRVVNLCGGAASAHATRHASASVWSFGD